MGFSRQEYWSEVPVGGVIMRKQSCFLLSPRLQTSVETDECLLQHSIVRAMKATLKPMIYIQVTFPKLKFDFVIPYLKSCSGSQSWLQGETQDLSMTSQDLSLSASGHPHLISHHDVGPVSLFFHPFTGNYLELFKDLVISRLRDLILFATDLILFATSALLHLAISSSLIRLFYYYGSSTK